MLRIKCLDNPPSPHVVLTLAQEGDTVLLQAHTASCNKQNAGEPWTIAQFGEVEGKMIMYTHDGILNDPAIAVDEEGEILNIPFDPIDPDERG